jgi:hypothetical protein
MAVITTSRATERLSRKMQRAGLNYWIGKSSGDKWGTYLRFEVGGKCVSGAGWTLRECAEYVDHLIAYKDYDEMPPFHFGG